MVALGPVMVGERSVVQTCRHLAPLERWLAEIGVPVGAGQPCPHDAEWGTWHMVNAALNVGRIRHRLAMDPCVIVEAYEGVLTRSDVTFYCEACRHAIVGRHPRVSTQGNRS